MNGIFSNLQTMSEENPENPKSVYDFMVKDTYDNDIPLDKYKGKVLLIVNIASRCGHTKKNYKELTELVELYKDKGSLQQQQLLKYLPNDSCGVFFSDFKILSFPCNQFGKQMPQKDGDAMMEHLEKKDANVGDVFKKIDVNGANAAPLYKFLKEKQGAGDRVKWNFVKFLVDKNGEPVERYGSSYSPKNIAPKIDELLKE